MAADEGLNIVSDVGVGLEVEADVRMNVVGVEVFVALEWHLTKMLAAAVWEAAAAYMDRTVLRDC